MGMDEQVSILLVDDRPENLLALEALLEPLNGRLVKANSGQEALKCLLQQDFAVILMDVQMPGMDGFETAELIRGRYRTQFTPIIFLTANNTSSSHIARGYALGAVDYLLKPIVPEVLRSKVSVFIELFKKTEEIKRQAAELNVQARQLKSTIEELEHQIAERRRAEEALRRAHDELEQRVQERTAWLAEANAALRVEIHERKKAVDALRESEARFRRLFESNIIGVIFPTLGGSILEANDVFLQMVGYTREDLQQGRLDWIAMSPPEYADQNQRVIAELRQTGVSPLFEHELQCKDGSRVAVVIAGAMLEGSESHTVAFVMDITDRKRAEQGLWFLAEASRLLSASLDYESSFAGVARLAIPWLADWCTIDLLDSDEQPQRMAVAAADPVKEQLEQQIQQAYPLSLDKPYGSSVVMRTSKAQIYTELTDELLRTGAHDEQHYQLLRSRGLRSLMSVPLETRGIVLGAISFGRGSSGTYGPADLALAKDLGCRVAVAIDNIQLYREAQQAIRARDTFLSIAAHELKTPLTALLGYTELIKRRAEREGSGRERDLQAIHVLSAQAGRLNRMVNSLLDLSRLQTGQLSIERGMVDLCALARRLIDEAKPTLQEHTIEYICPADGLMIEGDELRLEQVVQNLLQNAIKYSPGGGTITMTIEESDGMAIVAIKDQGMGIPADALPQLFRRFYRASNANALRISGMGVGLYVVREIVTLHGGEVEVESQEGQGSTFTIALPLFVPQQEAVAG